MTTPAHWQDFAEVMGGASAALTGLLFVAISLNAAQIAGHRGLRASGAAVRRPPQARPDRR